MDVTGSDGGHGHHDRGVTRAREEGAREEEVQSTGSAGLGCRGIHKEADPRAQKMVGVGLVDKGLIGNSAG